MIVLSLLIGLKTLFFISFTQVVHKPIIVFLFTLGVALAIIGLMSILKGKRKIYFLAIFYTFVSFIMFLDVMYFSYFNALPSVEMVGMMKMLPDVQNSVISLLSLRSLFFILDLPLVYFYLFKATYNDFLDNKQKLYFSGSMILLLMTIMVFLNSNNLINTLKYQEFFSYHINDIGNFFKDEEASAYQLGTDSFTDEDLEFLRVRAEFLEGPLTGIGKDKNLIVIQVEALQNFVINLEYNNQIITPNLNKLIQDSSTIYYDNYFQLLGRGNTSDSEFVSNNSLHPSMESPTYTQYEKNTFYGLPWVLRDNGYNAWAFHGYEKDFWNRDNAYKNQGFQQFISQDNYEIGDIIELGLTDEDFFDQSLVHLMELDEKSDKPFYAFMVTLSSHNPFVMPEEYNALEILPKQEKTILGDYFQSIHYVDKAIGKFIEDLKSKGLYDNSVIALYGDHFAIPNHKKSDVDMMSEFLGKKYYYDNIMNVPLIIHIPNSDVGYTNSKVGSQLDFFPTILNIMGYRNTKGIVFGVDLENYKGYHNVKPQTIMRKGSFIDNEVIFNMANTEIFEDCIVRDRKTGKKLDLDQFRPIYEEVIRELNIGEYVLKKDLLKKILSTDSNEEVSESKKLQIQDFYIQKLRYNSIDELDRIYKSGKNIIAIELTHDENKNIVLQDGNNTSLELLYNWTAENPDAKLLIRLENMTEELLNQLRYELPMCINNHIIEIDSFEEYYFVKSYGYEKILLNAVGANYTPEEIFDFTNAHSHFGIILPPEDINNEIKEEMYKLNIHLYMELPNSIQIFH